MIPQCTPVAILLIVINCAAVGWAMHRHSSHWSQRSQDRRTGTTSTLTQITNYPNTNANHNYRNANHPNITTQYTQVRSRPRPRLVLRTETRNRPRAERLRQRTHDGDQTAKRRPMGEFILIFVRAISMTSCFVHRSTRQSHPPTNA